MKSVEPSSKASPPAPERAGESIDEAAFWPQLVFQLPAEQAEAIEEALFASGAVSVIFRDRFDQPVLEPEPGEFRLWDQVRLIALYPQQQQPETILANLAELMDGQLPPYEWLPLADQQWERAWMDTFKPMQFGPSLWICPSHCQPPDSTAVNVKLDPGLAFGTGTHATTSQCLRWLGMHPVEGRSLIDYGCGSGVLAVAAALLGAGEVLAVDIDAQAISATQANAELNQVADRVQAGSPELVIGKKVDIIIANILYQPLIELAPQFAQALQAGGELVMSGILEEQIESIQLSYNQWFKFESSAQQEGWALLHAVRFG